MGRFHAALDAAPTASLSFAGADRVANYDGAVVVDAPDKVTGMPADAEVRR
jgi:hypothetical protein